MSRATSGTHRSGRPQPTRPQMRRREPADRRRRTRPEPLPMRARRMRAPQSRRGTRARTPRRKPGRRSRSRSRRPRRATDSPAARRRPRRDRRRDRDDGRGEQREAEREAPAAPQIVASTSTAESGRRIAVAYRAVRGRGDGPSAAAKPLTIPVPAAHHAVSETPGAAPRAQRVPVDQCERDRQTRERLPRRREPTPRDDRQDDAQDRRTGEQCRAARVVEASPGNGGEGQPRQREQSRTEPQQDVPDPSGLTPDLGSGQARLPLRGLALRRRRGASQCEPVPLELGVDVTAALLGPPPPRDPTPANVSPSSRNTASSGPPNCKPHDAHAGPSPTRAFRTPGTARPRPRPSRPLTSPPSARG